MVADDRIKRAAEEDEDIILLTDVVEEPPSEVVLEITTREAEPDSLLPRESASQDLPPPALGAPASSGRSPAAPVPQSPLFSQAEFEEAVRREVASFLSEARLNAILREVIQEKVENLSGELLTQTAREVLERKVSGLLKQLAAEED
jgi:hypothetical protein